MNININLGELSKPATVLIEKISDAIGGIARPGQIRRIAKAETDAEIIKAKGGIEINELQRRAFERMVYEEGQKQENIESITSKAIPSITNEAKPENIENDWIVKFFDQCRLTSDEEMQTLWAKILAGEANSPGTFSKRTLQLVATLDKRDAILFTKLCTFCWMIDGNLTPLILDLNNPTYRDNDINFSTLTHLDDIGLITFGDITGYQYQGLSKHVTLFYYGKAITIEFPNDTNNLTAGTVLLTQIGKELAPICGSKPSDDHIIYVLEKWASINYILSSPIRINN